MKKRRRRRRKGSGGEKRAQHGRTVQPVVEKKVQDHVEIVKEEVVKQEDAKKWRTVFLQRYKSHNCIVNNNCICSHV